MVKRKRIVCFTASYPFGNRETYFDLELKYLSKEFEEIIIVPRYNPYNFSEKREVPINVVVLDPIVPQGMERIIRGVFNLNPIWLFIEDFFSKRVFFDKRRIKKWLNSLLVYRITVSYFKKHVVKVIDNNTVLYSYWAEAPLFTSNLVNGFKKIVRMHGGDFYLNRNNGYLPLRKQIYDSSDLLLPISKDIARILKADYGTDYSKIFINYLGVERQCVMKHNKPNQNTQKIVLVSCSNVIPLKRVHLIVDALMLYRNGLKIDWHHFGDGTELQFVKERAKLLGDNISVTFHGWTEPQRIMEFYKQNYVSWFINVSIYEGIPVSIMEAFSFGIPSIATDVGGTSEIVNEKNGYLLPSNFDSATLLDRILSCDTDKKGYSCLRGGAYQTWENNFDASMNYSKLVYRIEQL